VLLWQMPETLAVTESGTRVEALAVSGDGRLLAAASGARVSLWDISHPRRLTRLGTLPQFPVLVNALAFQPGESGEPGGPGSAVLATGDASGAVRLWDVSAPTRPRETGALPQEASYPVRSLAFDAAGHTLIAATAQFEGGLFGGLRAWDVSDPTRPGVFHGDSLSEHQAPVNSVAAAPDGVYVYAADVSVGMLTVWRTREGAAPSLAGHRANGDQITYSLAADPRGGLIATGTAESDVRLWNVADPTSPRAMGDPLLAGGLAMSVGFSPDGELLAAGNSIGEIRLWRTSDPSRPTAYGLPVAGHGGEVTELAFGPRAGLLVTGGFDGTVRLWQTDPASARTMLCATTRSAMTPQRWERHVSPDLPYAPPCDDT
jgi:WD40 repeat protein